MTTMDLNTYKLDLIRSISAAESYEEVKRAFRTVSLRTASILKQTSAEEKEYISKEEVLDGIRRGLEEVEEGKRTGRRGKLLQEVIDEL